MHKIERRLIVRTMTEIKLQPGKLEFITALKQIDNNKDWYQVAAKRRPIALYSSYLKLYIAQICKQILLNCTLTVALVQIAYPILVLQLQGIQQYPL